MVEWLDTPDRHDPEWYETILSNWETLQSRLEDGSIGAGNANAVSGTETREGDGSRRVFEWNVDAPYDIEWASVVAKTEAASADHYVNTTDDSIIVEYSSAPARGTELEWLWAVGDKYDGRAGEDDVEGPVGIGDYYETVGDGEQTQFRWDTGFNNPDNLQYLNVDPATEAATGNFTREFDGVDIVVEYDEPPEDGAELAWYWAINSAFEVGADGIIYDALNDVIEFKTNGNVIGRLDKDGNLEIDGDLSGGNLEPIDINEGDGIHYDENGGVFIFQIDEQEVAHLDGDGNLTIDGALEGGSSDWEYADIEYLFSEVERIDDRVESADQQSDVNDLYEELSGLEAALNNLDSDVDELEQEVEDSSGGGQEPGIGGHYSTEGDGISTTFTWSTNVENADDLEYLNVDPSTTAASVDFSRYFDGTDIVVEYNTPPESGADLGWHWAVNSSVEHIELEGDLDEGGNIEDFSVVNVIDFGAEGDGETDDSDAVQAAANVVSDMGGGIVYLPPGQYALSPTINVDDYTIFKGRKGATEIIKPDSNSNDLFDFSFNNHSGMIDIDVDMMKEDGDGDYSWFARCRAVQDMVFRNINIHGLGGGVNDRGIYFRLFEEDGRDMSGNIVDNVNVYDGSIEGRNSGTMAIRMRTEFDNADYPDPDDFEYHAHNNRFINCYFEGAGKACIELVGPATIENTVRSCTARDYHTVIAPFQSALGAKDNTFDDCRAIDIEIYEDAVGSHGSGFVADGWSGNDLRRTGENVTFKNCVVRNVHSSDVGISTVGFDVRIADNIHIDGCSATDLERGIFVRRTDGIDVGNFELEAVDSPVSVGDDVVSPRWEGVRWGGPFGGTDVTEFSGYYEGEQAMTDNYELAIWDGNEWRS